MRGKTAKALRRAAYGDRARVKLYRVVDGQALTADPSRLLLKKLKRQRADRSTPDPKAARRAELAEKRKAGRRKAREKARRKPAPPPTVAEIIGAITVDMAVAQMRSAS